MSDLVRIKGLKTYFFTDEVLVKAIDGVDFSIPEAKIVCIVGESGSGKSMTGRSILNIVPRPGRIIDGQILWSPGGAPEIDLLKYDRRGPEIRKLRGKDIALISQEPMAALSPVHTVGNQMVETGRLHLGLSKADAKDLAIRSLGQVGIPDPRERFNSYAFQLSGGMRQRVCIALAIQCQPKLLIADEPTTALDVTTQANILDLFRSLRDEQGVSTLFITHDLGVVAEIADDVVVMYLGQVVEQAPVRDIFHSPLHPYTRALMESVPRLSRVKKDRLSTIRGIVPSPFNRPQGCLFSPRCDFALHGLCDTTEPDTTLLEDGRTARCLRLGEVA
jgi:peptide/nickel transport system ATP-binding protein